MGAGRHTDMNQFIGQKYNFLTVTSIENYIYDYKGKSMKRTNFNCKCDCGNATIAAAGNIRNGSIKSCGCKKKEIIQKAIHAYYTNKHRLPVEGKLFGNYKSQAKKHNRNFSLIREEFIKIVNTDCHYCGAVPELIRGNKTKSVTKALNGIDRIDSSKGYTPDNVVSCCPTCNRMKSDYSTKDFLEHIKKILNFQK
jgi:5-methylcytosine-specific restriction endonuclease McrA